MLILIIALIAAWATYQGLNNESFCNRYLFDSQAILRGGEYERMITSAFLHGDWMHYAFNFYSLYSFGISLEMIYGKAAVIAIFFTSVVGGSLLSLLLHRNRPHRALGASGGVCGVIFASIFLFPGMSIRMFMVPVSIPGWLYAIAYPIMSYVQMRRGNSRIGHDAHLGGAIAGLIACAILAPDLILAQPTMFAVVSVVCGIVLLILFKEPAFVRRTFESVGIEFESDTPYRPSLKHQRYDEAKDRAARRAELDALLDKISEDGMDSLTEYERERLEELSAKK
jgi:membrane associated rhomboid family serine protease